MARTPKPWYWKARKGYYVTIAGQRQRVGDTKKEAGDRFYDLMAHPQKRQLPSDSVVAVLDRFLEWVEKNRAPDTYEWYRQRLQAFAGRIGRGLKVRRLRPLHVQEFIDKMPHASGTKRNYVRAVKTAMKWALKQGYIDENPIAYMEKPKEGKREQVVSEEDFQCLLAHSPDAEFRDLLTVTIRTGCRPQESLRVEARHVDLQNSRWVFPDTEEKNKKLFRVVYPCFLRIRFTSTRSLARALSFTVQSMVTFFRTESTSSRAMSRSVGSLPRPCRCAMRGGA